MVEPSLEKETFPMDFDKKAACLPISSRAISPAAAFKRTVQRVMRTHAC
jgi:hypothetical protein